MVSDNAPQPVGNHALIDVFGPGEWGDVAAMEAILRDAANIAGATIIGAHFHHFGDGCGVTGVLMLAESHISVHTWPERQYAAFDIFMCGGTDIDAATNHIIAAFPDCRFERRTMARGAQ